MWIKCNPNPLDRQTGDCVVRAISVVTGRSWRETYRDLCKLGEIECEMPSSNFIWGTYLKKRGAKQYLLPDTCPNCFTVRAFCERYPEGSYVVGTGSHAVAVIDGDYYDAWDSGNEIVSYYWKIN